MFDDFFAHKQLRHLIIQGAEKLQSGYFDVTQLVKELSKGREDIDLIRSYIAIQTAAELHGPPQSSDIESAFKLLRASQRHLDMPEFGEILDIHRDLAEMLAERRRTAVFSGPGISMEAADTDARIARLRARLDLLVEGL